MDSTHTGHSTRDLNVGVRGRMTYLGFYETIFSIAPKLGSITFSQKT